MGGRDHSCPDCGRGGFDDPDGECECRRRRVGPVVTDDLLDYQTLRLEDEVGRKTAHALGRAADNLTKWSSEQIREAYMRGLKDGFAQGVAARPAPPASEGEGD